MRIPLEILPLLVGTLVGSIISAYWHGKARGHSETTTRLMAEWDASNARIFDEWKRSINRVYGSSQPEGKDRQ